MIGNKYIDDDGSGVFPKKNVRNQYNAKHQRTYSNRYYVIKNYYIKDTRIHQTYSVRKRRAAGYVYLNSSPYSDAEGSSQLISCLHDSIINSAPRIGGGVDNLELYRQCPPRRVRDTHMT